MEIDDKLVKKLANLSKLEIAAEDRNELKADFNKIIQLIDKLQEIDTTGVEPLVYLTENKNILRRDIVDNMMPKKQALKNAPDKDSDYFKVPKVLKK